MSELLGQARYLSALHSPAALHNAHPFCVTATTMICLSALSSSAAYCTALPLYAKTVRTISLSTFSSLVAYFNARPSILCSQLLEPESGFNPSYSSSAALMMELMAYGTCSHLFRPLQGYSHSHTPNSFQLDLIEH